MEASGAPTLEARLRAVEDQLAIMRLLAAYGPLVDAGECEAAAALWTPKGAYDIGDKHRAEGQAAIADLYKNETHQGLIRRGSGHVTGMPFININGDMAEAVAHSFVLLRGDEGWSVWRASANHWDLRRDANGWRIAERRNRILDGSACSHAALRAGIMAPSEVVENETGGHGDD